MNLILPKYLQHDTLSVFLDGNQGVAMIKVLPIKFPVRKSRSLPIITIRQFI